MTRFKKYITVILLASALSGCIKKVDDVFRAADSTCVWQQFYTVWNSGDNNSATLSIVNRSKEATGNDFALDDLFFGEVLTKQDSITVTIASLPVVKVTEDTMVCSGTPLQLMAETAAENTVTWSPVQYLNNAGIATPIATPFSPIKYFAEVIQK